MDEKQAQFSAALLSAIANPIRFKILQLLVQGETSVSAIASHVGLSQSSVSQHLSRLRMQQLVSTRREAQTIYYSSESPAVRALLSAVSNIIKCG
ncbi:ArsR/SmtB family transcription factor [Rhizobium sp. No.120]